MDFRNNVSFKSYGVKKPICRAHRQPLSRTFRIDEAQELLVKDNWSIESCFSATSLVQVAKENGQVDLHKANNDGRAR